MFNEDEINSHPYNLYLEGLEKKLAKADADAIYYAGMNNMEMAVKIYRTRIAPILEEVKEQGVILRERVHCLKHIKLP